MAAAMPVLLRPLLVGAHAAAAVEQEEHALVALVLEFAHDGPLVAQRGFPVDVAQRVAGL
jgi:hypothetical protein